MAANPTSDPKISDPKVAISNLAGLLVAVNRITDYLQTVAKNINVNLSLTDWLLLQTLAAEGPQPMSKAAVKIGVSRQRIHQQSAPLETSGLVTSKPGDGKSKVLEIAPAGRQFVSSLEKEFLKAISSEGGELAAGPAHMAKTGAARLAKVMILKLRAGKQDKE